MADAGWYPDPHDPHSQHYFDGRAWTGERRPTVAPGPEAPPFWAARPPAAQW